MKLNTFCVILFLNCIIYAQTKQPISTQPEPTQSIGEQITRIAKSVESLNKRLKTFSETFSSNQGLKLSDKQQDILFAFELLNRAEQSNSNLQKLKIDLTERRVTINTRLFQNQENSRPEKVDQSISSRGTTDAEAVRENRRQILAKERQELTGLLQDVTNQLFDVNRDILQTEQFIKNIRNRVFGEAEKALKDF